MFTIFIPILSRKTIKLGKMGKIFIAIFALICCGSAAAQGQALELSARYDDERNAIIEVTNHDGGYYSVVLELYDLSNFVTPKFHRERVTSMGQLLKLKPEAAERQTSFRYRYRYIYGAVNPRNVDVGFVYRLPFSLSASKVAIELSNFNDVHLGGDSSYENFKAFMFEMNRADTVYAARKGTIVRVIDEHDPIIGMGGVSMNSENNQVLVDHTDGTKAWYSVLEKGSIFVKPGDKVYPGTPIALAGTFDGEVYQMRFGLYYVTDNLSDITSLSDYSTINHGINPVFSTSDGEVTLTYGTTYTPVMSRDMVTAEMTKREIKILEGK
jgi:hypothetical protein